MIPTALPVVQFPNADNYPPLSALNDFLFCPRRCFLHRVEALWQDNVHTTAGTLDHQRVHQPRDAEESPYRTARGLRIVSHRLRLVGVTDLVEFHPNPNGGPETPYPVEYKRGKRRKWDNDEVQLCAQALCLEEMMQVHIPAGAIYHVKSRRRREVMFNDALRRQTETAAQRLHELLASGQTPPPVLHPKCKQCSVHDLCMPELISDLRLYQRAAAELYQVPG